MALAIAEGNFEHFADQEKKQPAIILRPKEWQIVLARPTPEAISKRSLIISNRFEFSPSHL